MSFKSKKILKELRSSIIENAVNLGISMEIVEDTNEYMTFNLDDNNVSVFYNQLEEGFKVRFLAEIFENVIDTTDSQAVQELLIAVNDFNVSFGGVVNMVVWFSEDSNEVSPLLRSLDILVNEEFLSDKNLNLYINYLIADVLYAIKNVGVNTEEPSVLEIYDRIEEI